MQMLPRSIIRTIFRCTINVDVSNGEAGVFVKELPGHLLEM